MEALKIAGIEEMSINKVMEHIPGNEHIDLFIKRVSDRIDISKRQNDMYMI